MKQLFSKIVCLLLILTLLLPGLTPPGAQAVKDILPAGLEGKTISILGDSISTFAGVSNDPNVNETLAGSAVFYQDGTLGVSRKDTWLQQTADQLGMKVLVNNSWSGSHAWKTSAGTVGAYIDRCVQLHSSAGIDPDLIALYLGTNDFGGSLYNLGRADELDYDALIIEGEDGFRYAEPANVCEAYAIMLHKMTVRYPDAEIYCMIPLPRSDPALVSLAEGFNASIKAIAQHFGAFVADLYGRTGIRTDEHFYYWLPDSIHPGKEGMDAITGCLISSILENSRYVAQNVHSVEYDLKNVRVDQGTAYAALENAPFHCTVTGPLAYDFSVRVTMNGQDVTDLCYSNSEIRIEHVTGPVRIQVSPVLPGDADENYRWIFNGNDLTPAETPGVKNPLTRLQGMVVNGFHLDTVFRLGKPIVLRHDRPWVLEWRSISIWGSNTGGVMLLSTAQSALTKDSTFLYQADGTNHLTLGYYDGAQYHGYGVDLSSSGFDLPAEHIFRLENRLADDGSNMIYLLIDGVEIGPMNQYYRGAENTHTTNNWLRGKDLIFRYMGANEFPITLHNIDYFQASQCNHDFSGWTSGDGDVHSRVCSFCHTQEQVAHAWDDGVLVKEPSCAEEGEMTFTCADCGAAKTHSVQKTEDHTYDHHCDPTCNICGAQRRITHKYSESWQQDASGHWRSCSICGHKKDESSHRPGPEATEEAPQICQDCGYVICPALGHTHKWSESYAFDESGHWLTCSGCEEKEQLAQHRFDHGCDTDCDDCGFTRATEHIPGPAATETEDQVCTECGAVLQSATGPIPTEPSQPLPTQPAPTEPKPTEPARPDPGKDNTGIIVSVVAIVLVALGGSAALLIRKKKK
jgi:lysophospholipase L1-like esterase